MRTILKVPFEQKEHAKSLGARWDPLRKYWYAPEGADLHKFRHWLSDDRGQWSREFKRFKKARRRRDGMRIELTPEQAAHMRDIRAG